MNLIDTLKNEMGGEAVNLLSQKVNITSEQTQSGLSAIIPTVLAGIIKKVSGTGSLGSLGPIFTGNVQSVEVDPESEYGDTSSLLRRGSMIVGDLFGGKTEEISNEVSKKTSLSIDKSKNLLTMAMPLIMGHIDKLIANKGLTMPDFVGKLFEEKASVENQLPSGLVSSFGLSGLSLPHLNQAHISDSFREKVAPIGKHAPLNPVVPERSSSGGLLKWIAVIAIIALIAWWFISRNNAGRQTVENRVDTLMSRSLTDTVSSLAKRSGEIIAGSLNEAGDWVYNLGANKTIKLPDGASLNVGENSSESKLIAFIEDTNKKVNDTTWISLDRLFFEKGVATLKPESRDQLGNIATIMNSYPNVRLKIGGYTDNTGSIETNMKVSTERANAAMKDLIALGVSADRLKAEGYGQEHPIADNSTEEGRAQNRRIDIRVTEK